MDTGLLVTKGPQDSALGGGYLFFSVLETASQAGRCMLPNLSTSPGLSNGWWPRLLVSLSHGPFLSGQFGGRQALGGGHILSLDSHAEREKGKATVQAKGD